MNPEIKNKGYGFAIYPSVKLKGYKYNKKKKKYTFGFLKELIFGDYIKPKIKDGKYETKTINGKVYIKVRARNKDGYILPNQIQAERVLEVNFVDVAQGDGCHLVTPDDKHYIIDAGKGDNMYRFLSWRFNLKNQNSTPPTFTGIISHCDEDHYGGFTKLFTNTKFSFDTIYHNGIVEESGSHYSKLGDIFKESNGDMFVTNLCITNDDYKERVNTVTKAGNYIKMLEKTNTPKKALLKGTLLFIIKTI